jgi:hypothetical protein
MNGVEWAVGILDLPFHLLEQTRDTFDLRCHSFFHLLNDLTFIMKVSGLF